MGKNKWQMKLHPSRLLLQTTKNKESTLPGTHTCRTQPFYLLSASIGGFSLVCLQVSKWALHSNLVRLCFSYKMAVNRTSDMFFLGLNVESPNEGPGSNPQYTCRCRGTEKSRCHFEQHAFCLQCRRCQRVRKHFGWVWAAWELVEGRNVATMWLVVFMCRQPQQKSGSGQPRCSQNQHRTEAQEPQPLDLYFFTKVSPLLPLQIGVMGAFFSLVKKLKTFPAEGQTLIQTLIK